MNGFVMGAIALFVISSLIVVGGALATNRFRQTAADTPGALGPGFRDWLLPALGVDAIAVVLLVVGLSR